MKRHWVLWTFLGIAVVFAFLPMVASYGGFSLLTTAATGWFSFLQRTLPKLTWNRDLIGMAIVSVALILFIAHKLLSGLAKHIATSRGTQWRWPWNSLVLNGEPVQYQPIAEELLRDIASDDRKGHVFASEQLPGQAHAVTGNPTAPAMRSFAPQRVPEGHYFMMGDNRDDIFDSRYWGTVDRKQIVGRATSVVISLDREHHWSPRWQRFFTSLRHD